MVFIVSNDTLQEMLAFHMRQISYLVLFPFYEVSFFLLAFFISISFYYMVLKQIF